MKLRIGQGWDRHRFCEGTSLRLGGVDIPFERSLLGHSDADALCHALIDALLGAAHLGDIGRLFPDTDPAYENIDSMLLLQNVLSLLQQRGWQIMNVDCTIITQQPKLAPYIPLIEESLAKAMGLPADAVSVKAKTAEGLGPVGRQECLEAMAVALLQQRNDFFFWAER
ncbi:MAG: 2-C-methyl-D-erythritol 2,4-cyclodiphosphate synthase [Bacillota bacterium]|nr:2-C-methyl-D-erythritol 2,4-cyclodiphosphate synthase [Bacillota bacterium]